jgi:hypothetical protein
MECSGTVGFVWAGVVMGRPHGAARRLSNALYSNGDGEVARELSEVVWIRGQHQGVSLGSGDDDVAINDIGRASPAKKRSDLMRLLRRERHDVTAA